MYGDWPPRHTWYDTCITNHNSTVGAYAGNKRRGLIRRELEPNQVGSRAGKTPRSAEAGPPHQLPPRSVELVHLHLLITQSTLQPSCRTGRRVIVHRCQRMLSNLKPTAFGSRVCSHMVLQYIMQFRPSPDRIAAQSAGARPVMLCRLPVHFAASTIVPP